MTVLSWIPVGVGLRGTSYGGTEAEIIAWLDDFFTKMDTLNWTKTSDTGQYVIGGGGKTYLGTINNEVLAFRLYRFDDVHVATNPLYIRLEFRRNYSISLANGAFVQSIITVGTATDGAGTITTDVQSISQIIGSNNATIQVFSLTSKQSFACSVPSKGFIGVIFNPGNHLSRFSTSYPTDNLYHCDLAFFIERIPNPDGTPSTQGFTLFGPNHAVNYLGDYSLQHNYTNASLMKTRTKIFSGSLYDPTTGIPIFPQTFLMNDFLLNHFYHSVPTPVRSLALSAIKPAMLGGGTQFSAVAYGATENNYIVIPFTSALRPATSGMEVAMLWE